jgi:hypothetical protein
MFRSDLPAPLAHSTVLFHFAKNSLSSGLSRPKTLPHPQLNNDFASRHPRPLPMILSSHDSVFVPQPFIPFAPFCSKPISTTSSDPCHPCNPWLKNDFAPMILPFPICVISR